MLFTLHCAAETVRPAVRAAPLSRSARPLSTAPAPLSQPGAGVQLVCCCAGLQKISRWAQMASETIITRDSVTTANVHANALNVQANT